jgi:hypothetical protein
MRSYKTPKERSTLSIQFVSLLFAILSFASAIPLGYLLHAILSTPEGSPFPAKYTALSAILIFTYSNLAIPVVKYISKMQEQDKEQMVVFNQRITSIRDEFLEALNEYPRKIDDSFKIEILKSLYKLNDLAKETNYGVHYPIFWLDHHAVIQDILINSKPELAVVSDLFDDLASLNTEFPQTYRFTFDKVTVLP